MKAIEHGLMEATTMLVSLIEEATLASLLGKELETATESTVFSKLQREIAPSEKISSVEANNKRLTAFDLMANMSSSSSNCYEKLQAYAQRCFTENDCNEVHHSGYAQSSNCLGKTSAPIGPQGLKSVPVSLKTATLGSNVKLPCHFCQEKQSITGRIWHHRNLHGTERAVKLDMHDDDSKNRVFVTRDHTLVIRGITEKDGGYYFCYDSESKSGTLKVDILLDVGSRSSLDPVVLDTNVDLGKEVRKWLTNCDKLKNIPSLTKYRCYFEWGKWSKCDGCGRLAERRKIGECRLQKLEKAQIKSLEGKMIETDFPVVGVGCNSFLLNDVPKGKRILSEIPNLVLKEKCEVPCKSFAKARKMIAHRRGSFLRKIKMKVAHKMKEVSEPLKFEKKEEKADTRLTLFCPGASYDMKVKWKFKGKLLKSETLKMKSGGRVYIDEADALHIKELRNIDAGEYTCTHLGIEIGLIRLKVKSTHVAFDPTTNFGIFTIGMTIGLLVWLALMSVKCRLYRNQIKAQQRRHQNRYNSETSSLLQTEETDTNDTSNTEVTDSTEYATEEKS